MQATMEPIKLRNLNLATRHQDALFVRDKKAQGQFIDPLRKPEPAVIQSRRSRRFSIGLSSLKDLGDVREEYNAPSPLLEHTLALCQRRVPDISKPIRFCDGTFLDISGGSDFDNRGFDCQPFFHSYNYESRYGRDDYEFIINKMINDEMNSKRPIFQRELEFLEVQRMVRSVDYVMFYLFGIDRLGYFKLKQERESFHNSLYEAYSSSLRYNEDESSDSESRTGDEESSSTAHTDDKPEAELPSPPV